MYLAHMAVYLAHMLCNCEWYTFTPLDSRVRDPMAFHSKIVHCIDLLPLIWVQRMDAGLSTYSYTRVAVSLKMDTPP